MRRRDGSFPPKRTSSEMMEDLNNKSDEFKQTILYKRLVLMSELLREVENTKRHTFQQEM